MKRRVLSFQWAHIVYVDGEPRTEHLFDLRADRAPLCPKLGDFMNPCQAPDSGDYWKMGEQWVEACP